MSSIAAGTTTTTALVYTADTSGVLQLQTNGTTTAVTIDTSQNVGIGTTSPGSKLEVYGISRVSTSNANSAIFQVTSDTTGSNGVLLESTYYGSGGYGPLKLKTGGSVQATLDSNGRLGIGITPVTTSGISLEMGGSSNFNSINFNNSATYQGWIVTNAYWNGTNWINIQGGGTTSTAFASNYQGTFRWYVGSNGSSGGTLTSFNPSSGTPNMILDSTGNLLVGATSTIASERLNLTNGGTSLGMYINYTTSPNNTSNEFIYCHDSTAVRAYIRSNGGFGNYQANNVNLSDQREKKDIQLAPNYLDKICQIPVKTFLFNDQTDTELNLGVIAQDVQSVCPELVTESNWAGKNEPEKMRLSIYQTDLQYALMKCIQELSAKVTALEAKVGA